MAKFKSIDKIQYPKGFRPVNPQVNFVELEKATLKRWYDEGIVEKYLHKNDQVEDKFSFLDGPITANNPMGVHHAWGRTYKDLWQRFNNMKGKKQRFQNGFDEQGLWVEVEVEKELGLKSKKDIENLVPADKFASLEKFVNLCKERVIKYADIQTEQSKRLGYLMDWDNSYHTSSDENNYWIWHFLKTVHEKGWLYKGHDAVPWCPRCGTAISQHEILTEEYKEVTHKSIYFQLPIKDKEKTFLLVWTTTPWTIPANVAVAVDPALEYQEVVVNDSNLIVAKDAAARLFSRDALGKSYRGKELVGWEYEGPFDGLPSVKEAFGEYKHRVISSDPVVLPISIEDGTGLVHIAPGAGSEDFQLGLKEKLPVISPIDDAATFVEGFDFLTGKKTDGVVEEIVQTLDDGGFLHKTEDYIHRYPTCWRCKTELVWRVVDEWYIAMDRADESGKTYREQMIDVAKQINWIPDWGLGRELDWLNNMHDWLISKKRYWGLALPIWECDKCGNFEVVDGKDELKEKAVEGWDAFEGHTPHKPWIDQIRIRCTKCNEVATRIPDVGNPWLDAGIVPFSTLPKDWRPADFVTESFPGQFKNWFYSLIAMSTALKQEVPTQNLLGFATMLDGKGKPFHKSAGNSIEFVEGADRFSADAIRWICISSDPANNILFGPEKVDETRRKFFLMLWNIYNFHVTYANISEYNPGNISESQNVLDQWIKARLKQLAKTVEESLEKYNARQGALDIEVFIQDLSLWYVRRSRDRVGSQGLAEDRNACFSTLHTVLVELSKILMPFTPFIAEEIYTNLTGEESVNLAAWPEVRELSSGELKVIEEMAVVRKVVERGHAARKITNIPVRQPLAKITILHFVKQPSDSVLQLIKDELNIKNIEWKERNGLKEPEVELDTTLTPELEEEGKTRELARAIQDERKKLGVQLNEEVAVKSPWLPTNPELVEWLKRKTLAKSLEKGKELKVDR
ncbi:MAG: isoleucine--tRNA ligase [Patescibacteria group bacterium]